MTLSLECRGAKTYTMNRQKDEEREEEGVSKRQGGGFTAVC